MISTGYTMDRDGHGQIVESLSQSNTSGQALVGEVISAPVSRPSGKLRGRSAGYVQPDWVRGKIQTTVVLKRLFAIGMGREGDVHPARVTNQINALRILLAKSLPDLQSIDLRTDGDRPIVIVTRME